MFCPRCGTACPDDTAICPRCMTQFSPSVPPPAPEPAPAPTQPTAPIPSTKANFDSNWLWLAFSILSFFCCQPLGLAAIIFAAMAAAISVSSPEQSEKARKLANWAKIFAGAATAAGLLVWFLYFLYIAILSVAIAMSN